MDALIIQNILFVTGGKWRRIFLSNGSDINLLKRDAVKWQKQRDEYTARARGHKFRVRRDTQMYNEQYEPSPSLSCTGVFVISAPIMKCLFDGRYKVPFLNCLS